MDEKERFMSTVGRLPDEELATIPVYVIENGVHREMTALEYKRELFKEDGELRVGKWEWNGGPAAPTI